MEHMQSDSQLKALAECRRKSMDIGFRTSSGNFSLRAADWLFKNVSIK